MSGTRASLAKKSSDSDRKNLKAPKKHYFRRMHHRTRRSRHIPENKPPIATGGRLVFTRNRLSGVFEDCGSRVAPIDTEMPKEALMPFWQSLETIENYSTVKITQKASKRGKIGCASICVCLLVIIVLGSMGVEWLFVVGFFVGACAIMGLFSWIHKDHLEQ
jgi:hypothetical protein